MKLTIVISTYKQNVQLRLILRALNAQTDRSFHVVVANDGGDRSAEQIALEFSRCGMPVKHVYLEPTSERYRACAVRNAGLALATAPRTLFLDGDSVPDSRAVEIHGSYGQKSIVQSQRLLIPRNKHNAKTELSDLPQLVCRSRFNGTLQVFQLAYNQCWTYALSYPTEVIKWLGGFDELLEGHFGNDVDLADRCFQIGLEAFADLRTATYHLGHHRPYDTPENRQAMKQALVKAKKRGLVRNK